MIRKFRNEVNPKVAVTVDLLTTGIDVPAICNLVFIRRVNSRILYEQMLGRATRLCDEIGKEVFHIFDAVRLYEAIAPVSTMKPIVVNPNITFTQLLQELETVNKPDAVEIVIEQLLAKLQRQRRQGAEAQLLQGYRWDDLVTQDGVEQLTSYRKLLLMLGSENSSLRVQAIFANAQTSLKQPRILKKLVTSIDELDWFSEHRDEFGDLYEGLLQKNADEKKSGAGQYFTPRPLIDCMVSLLKPQPGELIQDPAAGTAGFLIASDRYIRQYHDSFEWTEAQQSFQQHQAFYGMELVQDAHRLLLMNMMLHGIEGAVDLGDSLSAEGQRLAKADVILTNPPFGTKKGGGLPSRDDFTYPTSNKQLAFLQHIYRTLKPGGRAAVVLPDNVLFEDGQGRSIRADLMAKCNLHTILRLPTGIFYAQGVKTNVLFFQRGTTEKGNTKAVWIYDMRTNMPSFGKRIPLTRGHFSEFEQCYGDEPNGNSLRVDLGENGRFRCFTREQITKRNENLDISWLRDDSLRSGDNLPEPEIIAAEIIFL